MKNFTRGLVYYLLNTVVLNFPFWFVRRKILNFFGYKIDLNSSVHIGCLIFGKGDSLKIGAHTTVNSGCILDARGNLKIGDGCSISRGVTFITRTHDYSTPDFELEDTKIEIGDNVWIGSNAIILPNISIGDNCIIGAGSVITKNCKPAGVYVGNPAKLIKINESHFKINQSFVPWFGLQN